MLLVMPVLQPKEFETRVQVIERYPEMKTVEKTDFVKEVHQEEKLISVPKTRVVMDEVETVDIVPVVKKVPKTRVEIVHRVVEEEQTFTDMVDVVEQVEVPRKEVVPRVVTEEVEETVIVPVVREVPVTTTTEVPTGKYVIASNLLIFQCSYSKLLYVLNLPIVYIVYAVLHYS